MKLKLRKELFWDVEPNDLDPKLHKRFILNRVLSKGNLNDFVTVKNYYGIKTLQSEVTVLRNLDKKTIFFLSTYLDIPREKFRCYN